MKKIILGLALVSIILSGCTLPTAQKATEKKLEESKVTRVGTISTKSGEEYILTTEEGPVGITSTKINLDNYLKKKVKVTGMFSGSTLYVDKVELSN